MEADVAEAVAWSRKSFRTATLSFSLSDGKELFIRSFSDVWKVISNTAFLPPFFGKYPGLVSSDRRRITWNKR
jgi:hypothetical protein